MQYFELISKTIDNVEFQHWGLVARNDEDYFEHGYDKDPCIIPITKIPKYKFNLSLDVIDKNGIFHKRNPKDFLVGKKIIVKESKKAELINIDAETTEKLKIGFIFDKKTFSLSSNAQLNWHNIIHLFNMKLYTDTLVSTKDNDTYLLKKEDVHLFFNTYLNTLNEILKEGQNKKFALINSSCTEYLKANKNLVEKTSLF